MPISSEKPRAKSYNHIYQISDGLHRLYLTIYFFKNLVDLFDLICESFTFLKFHQVIGSILRS